MRITIPTYFTLFRLVLIPLMVLTYFLLPERQSHFFTALIFLIASITDWIDGYLARRLHQTSSFGRFLDPVADKLIVAVALILIVYEYVSPHINVNGSFDTNTQILKAEGVLVTVAAFIILSREIIVTSLREWMANLGQSSKVAVSYLAKLKTAAQMTSIVFLLWRPSRYSSTIWYGHNWIEYISVGLIWFAVALTIWSMVDYLKIGYTSLLAVEKEEDQDKQAQASVTNSNSLNSNTK